MIKEDMAPISSIDYYNHAVCYRHGYGGVPINKKTAINLFIKSGELGNPEGFAVAARMYESGEGVLTDMNTAIKLFKKAVKGGNTAAMINLAYDYRNGENGLPKNLPEAVKLYQLAVQKAIMRLTATLQVCTLEALA